MTDYARGQRVETPEGMATILETDGYNGHVLVRHANGATWLWAPDELGTAAAARPTYRPVPNPDAPDGAPLWRTSDGSTFATESDASLYADPAPAETPAAPAVPVARCGRADAHGAHRFLETHGPRNGRPSFCAGNRGPIITAQDAPRWCGAVYDGAVRITDAHPDGIVFACDLPAGHDGRHEDHTADAPAILAWNATVPA